MFEDACFNAFEAALKTFMNRLTGFIVKTARTLWRGWKQSWRGI
jgi:hypothetical protein